jgi:putative FmdB family regulatory protein
MPTYDYQCNKCEMIWEDVYTIADRATPLSKPCPHCKKKKCVEKAFASFPGSATDTNITPDKKTGGQWSELINRIKKGVPEYSKNKLDRATNHSGHQWRG